MTRRAEPGGWYEDFRYRLRFEGPARQAYQSLRATRTGKGINTRITYAVSVTVPEYGDQRAVKIRLANYTRRHLVTVTVGGPTESPHRYADGALGMWYPEDGLDRKWQPEEGLLTLIRYGRLHLFQETYWREYGDRPGPEAPHAPQGKEAA